MNIKRRLILQKFIVLITTYHFLPKFDFTSSSENYTEKFDTIIALLLPNFSLSGLVNTISGIPSSEKECERPAIPPMMQLDSTYDAA